MPESPGSSGRVSSPEPFIAFPLWGIRKALADHKRLCSACSGVQPAECIDAWYSKLLNDKILVLASRHPKVRP